MLVNSSRWIQTHIHSFAHSHQNWKRKIKWGKAFIDDGDSNNNNNQTIKFAKLTKLYANISLSKNERIVQFKFPPQMRNETQNCTSTVKWTHKNGYTVAATWRISVGKQSSNENLQIKFRSILSALLPRSFAYSSSFSAISSCHEDLGIKIDFVNYFFGES